MGRHNQQLLLIEKCLDGSLIQTPITPVQFVPMTGENGLTAGVRPDLWVDGWHDMAKSCLVCRRATRYSLRPFVCFLQRGFGPAPPVAPAAGRPHYFRSMTEAPSLHVPVLLDEVLVLASAQARAVLVDGTLGGGGHTRRWPPAWAATDW